LDQPVGVRAELVVEPFAAVAVPELGGGLAECGVAVSQREVRGRRPKAFS
jgi:hypothetical protein